ncbi:hypothetical protein Rhsp01_14250 [Rhizobium sp. NBRC 114257]|uniref:Uncharacterized protein n=1 Tax=Rhizobium dioscoreae TaxID=2653122 RepID=A0ABQ0YZV1_9HYPH|nr:hypothetical protein RsS93_14200 [Rhizobium dioscoreae]GLU80249.1 hypothetical protein Rhsp01_14250 [Rhizobium sp. NBRC 114257]
MFDALKMLADDMQTTVGHDSVHIRHASNQAVFAWQEDPVDFTADGAGDRGLQARHGDAIRGRERHPAGDICKCAGPTIIADFMDCGLRAEFPGARNQ